MHTPRTILIAGINPLTKELTRALSNGTDRVLVFDPNTEDASLLAGSLQQAHPYYDVQAVTCSFDACWEADIILLALDCADLAPAAEKLRSVATQKIVVTTEDRFDLLCNALPHSKVVKAFHNLAALNFYLPLENRKFISCPVNGTDEEACATVSELIASIGFLPDNQYATRLSAIA